VEWSRATAETHAPWFWTVVVFVPDVLPELGTPVVPPEPVVAGATIVVVVSPEPVVAGAAIVVVVLPESVEPAVPGAVVAVVASPESVPGIGVVVVEVPVPPPLVPVTMAVAD
jgi:hypothetical protein